MIIVITTKKEKSCLAPDKKLKQISNELREKVIEICLDDKHNPVKTLISRLEDLKSHNCLEEIKFLVETKDSELITVLGDYNCLHTGDTERAINLDDDKAELKWFLNMRGIAVANGFICPKDPCVELFEYPCFIKPSDDEDSVGIDTDSLCRTPKQAEKVLKKLGTEKSILVEEYLSGEEYTVAIVKKPDGSYLVLPARMDMPMNEHGDKFLDYKLKLSDDCKLKADMGEKKRKELVDLALNTFEAIGATKYARIDIRDDLRGKAKVMEVNLYAGLGIDGYMANCFRAYNLSYRRMLEEVLSTTELELFYARK